MISLYTQATHMKFVYDKATEVEFLKSERILKEKFQAKDTSLSRTAPVRRNIASDIRSFYNDELHIMPIGFLKFIEYYYDLEKIDYVIKEMRRYPKPNKEFLRLLMKGDIEMGGEFPRPYQIDAVVEAVRQRIGGIEVFTGLGKTLIMAILCKVYSESRILILENTIDLVQQTYEKLYKCGLGAELGVIQGANDDDEKRITILCLQSYEKAFNLFPEIQVILADEAHETGRTDTAEKVIYSCQNAPVKFSISATMQTIDNPYESMRLVGNMGPVIYQKNADEGIDEEYLTPTKIEIYQYECEPVPIVGTWSDVYDKIEICPPDKKHTWTQLVEAFEQQNNWAAGLMELFQANMVTNDEECDAALQAFSEIFSKAGYEVTQKGDILLGRKIAYRGDEYTHIVDNKTRNQVIVKIINRYLAQKKRILVLFNRIEHGEILQSMCPGSVLIHGEDDLKARKEAEMYLRENEGVVVFASKIWRKGIDIEQIDNYVNGGGGKSATDAIQKLGRVVRKSRTTEKNIAVVADLDDSCVSPIGRKQSEKRIHVYQDELKLPMEYINI